MGASRESNPGPADELDALRAILMAELRRRPGDTASLTRKAESLTRMMVAQRRLMPGEEEKLRVNVERVLSSFEDKLVPSERG